MIEIEIEIEDIHKVDTPPPPDRTVQLLLQLGIALIDFLVDIDGPPAMLLLCFLLLLLVKYNK